MTKKRISKTPTESLLSRRMRKSFFLTKLFYKLIQMIDIKIDDTRDENLTPLD